METRSGRSLPAKLGLGCLGIVGLGVVAVVLVAVILAVAPESPRVDVDRTAELPQPAPGAGVPEGSRAPLRVELDLGYGDIRVEPGKPGEPPSVEARYDPNAYVLEQSASTAGDGGFAWTVRFDRRAGAFNVSALRAMLGLTTPTVRVLLPPDERIDLHARVRRGGSRLELGGLDLAAVEIEARQGGAAVTFASPTAEPIARFVLHAEQGGVAVVRLGNASPAVVDIEHRMGGGAIDFSGAWRNDADVTVRSSMGGMSLRVPEDVRVEGVSGEVAAPGPGPEVGHPTLRFSIESKMGETKVVRR